MELINVIVNTLIESSVLVHGHDVGYSKLQHTDLKKSFKAFKTSDEVGLTTDPSIVNIT